MTYGDCMLFDFVWWPLYFYYSWLTKVRLEHVFLYYHLVTYPLFIASIIFTYKSRYLCRGQLGPSWPIQLSTTTDLSTSMYTIITSFSTLAIHIYIYIYISTYINKTRTSWPINLPINYNPHLANSHFDPGAPKYTQQARTSLCGISCSCRGFFQVGAPSNVMGKWWF